MTTVEFEHIDNTWSRPPYLIRRYRDQYTAYYSGAVLGTFAKLKLAFRACRLHDDGRSAEAYCRDLEARMRLWRADQKRRLKPQRRRK
jgi:hypothetical protein